MCVNIWAFPSESMVKLHLYFKIEWASLGTDCCKIFSIANLKKARSGASTVFPKNLKYTAVILYFCEIHSCTSCAYGCVAPPLPMSYMIAVRESANIAINPFVPSAPFLYPLKTSENRKVF